MTGRTGAAVISVTGLVGIGGAEEFCTTGGASGSGTGSAFSGKGFCLGTTTAALGAGAGSGTKAGNGGAGGGGTGGGGSRSMAIASSGSSSGRMTGGRAARIDPRTICSTAIILKQIAQRMISDRQIRPGSAYVIPVNAAPRLPARPGRS